MAKDYYSNLDLNLLRTLLVLFQELNMRKAAERLFVSQPAVSQALAKLRNHFDEELFVKTRQGLKPTSFCEELVGQLQPVMNQLQNRLSQRKQFDPAELQGTLRIAMSPQILTGLARQIFLNVREQAPKVDLHLVTWTDKTMSELLSEKTLLGINFDIPHAPKELYKTELAKDQWCIAVRNGHPYPKDTITVSDMADFEVASQIIPDWNSNQTYTEKVMASHGHQIRVGFRSELSTAMFDVLEASDLVYPCSTLTCIGREQNFRFITIIVDNAPINEPVFTYSHLKHRHNPTVAWFSELLKQLITENQ